jgi:hypothetical protein
MHIPISQQRPFIERDDENGFAARCSWPLGWSAKAFKLACGAPKAVSAAGTCDDPKEAGDVGQAKRAPSP